MSDEVINNIHLDINILRQLFITCFLRETTCARGHWVYTISVLSNPFLHSGQGDRDCARVIPSTMSHAVQPEVPTTLPLWGTEQPKLPG